LDLEIENMLVDHIGLILNFMPDFCNVSIHLPEYHF
jgi:hypothetical protein